MKNSNKHNFFLDDIVTFVSLHLFLIFCLLFLSISSIIIARTTKAIMIKEQILINNVDVQMHITKEWVTETEQTVGEETLKQIEIRNVIVLVSTKDASGSGTIIDQIKLEDKNLYEYRVLSNAHVTYSRLIQLLKGVDAITGKLNIQTIDTGCKVVVFDYDNNSTKTINAKVLLEDTMYDLAMLSFESPEILPVARIASQQMLSQVRVFDEIFAVGCQLGRPPTPTNGIISKIIKGNHKNKEWIIYGMTSQITPGSSGGGLFKEYYGHYYLIGIPYRIAVARNGQMIPHLAHAISIFTAKDFIDLIAITIP